MNQNVQAPQQSAAACQCNTVIDDIRCQFRRCLLQGIFDGINDASQRFQQDFPYFRRSNIDIFRQTIEKISALNLHHLFCFYRIGGTNLYFNIFCCTFTDQKIITFFDVVDNGSIQFISGTAHGTGNHNAAQRDYCHFTGSAANIDNHAAAWFQSRQTGTNCRRHRFFDDVDLFGTGLISGILYGTAFYGCYAGRNADNDSGFGKHFSTQRFADEFLQHDNGGLKICNDTVFQRTNGYDGTRSTTNDIFCFFSDIFCAVCMGVDRYNRRLSDNNASSSQINQSICCSKVNSDIFCKHFVHSFYDKSGLRLFFLLRKQRL